MCGTCANLAIYVCIIMSMFLNGVHVWFMSNPLVLYLHEWNYNNFNYTTLRYVVSFYIDGQQPNQFQCWGLQNLHFLK